MLTLAAFVVATALSAAPALEVVPPPSTESTSIADLQLAPEPIPAAPPPQGNCQVTCWSTGVTYSTGASSMNQCGQFGDQKCGVCNWDGLYNWRPFANC